MLYFCSDYFSLNLIFDPLLQESDTSKIFRLKKLLMRMNIYAVIDLILE